MKSMGVWACAAVLAAAGCRSAYYGAMEKVGYEKRDILSSRIRDAQGAQSDASEQFTDALETLQSIYGSPGTDLEKVYRRMKSDFEDCASRATEVRERIQRMDTVAGDLFKEWEAEAKGISTDTFRTQSLASLRTTKAQYATLRQSMKQAESGMAPVLKKFEDQVLFLKHNLNAAAIGSLQTEGAAIQKEIRELIESMQASIREADSFIEAMPKE